MSEQTEAETVAELTERAIRAEEERDPWESLDIRSDGTTIYQRRGQLVAIDGAFGAAAPKRAQQDVTVYSAESFVEAIDHYQQPDDTTTVFLDLPTLTCTAVLNDHDSEGFGWADRRIVYQAKETDAWAYWVRNVGPKSVSQFAEIISEGREDIVTPNFAELLMLTENLTASVEAKVVNTERLSDGQRKFVLDEKVVMTGGGSEGNTLAIPAEFVLGLQPIEGARTYEIHVDLRTAVRDGVLSIGYVLIRPNDFVRSAYKDVTDDLRTRLADQDISRFLDGPAPRTPPTPTAAYRLNS